MRRRGAALQPEGVEQRWQRTWEEEGLYTRTPIQRGRASRAPTRPRTHRRLAHGPRAPALARGHDRPHERMPGLQRPLQTGFDQAGISTQNAVERHLATQGTTRQELGREVFVARSGGLREYGGKSCSSPPDRGLARLPPASAYDGRRIHPGGMRFFVHLHRRGASTAPTDHQLVPVHGPRSRTWSSSTGGRRRTHLRASTRSRTATRSGDSRRCGRHDPRRRRRRRAPEDERITASW